MPLSAVAIDKLSFGGNGVCRIDGKVCFVPFSCPGDEVSLRVTYQKKSYCIASINKIINPSPSRVTPECPIFGACGGCCWQHIGYATQLEHKRKIMEETLWRGARVRPELIEDVVDASMQYGYRSRLQFKVSSDGGRIKIGFYRQGSHQVEDAVAGCPVARPIINQVLSRCREVLQSYPDINSVSQICIDAGDKGVMVVIQHERSVTLDGRRYLVDKADALWPCAGLFIKENGPLNFEKLWGCAELSYFMGLAGIEQKQVIITYSPGGFAQVNQLQNIAMLSVIRRLGTFLPTEHLLDLYCGNGNFSLPLAFDVASVTGIEGNKESINSAERNRLLNEVANASFFCEDVTSGVRRLADKGRIFDTVLLDPPRSGAGNSVNEIVRLRPNKIIYVSCDPSTLARDCGIFSGFGYSVVKSVPIDMFPQTYHIESVTLLKR